MVTIVLLVVILAAIGLLIGNAIRTARGEAEASKIAEASRQEEEQAAREAEESDQAAEEEAKAQAEQEEAMLKLLEEQSREANKEKAESIKGAALLGVANVGAYLKSKTTAAEQAADATSSNGHIVCIDAGHEHGSLTDTEPNAPGSSEMKQKLSSGTYGEASGLWEYQLNLTVALKVQSILESRGYTVIMTRTTNDVTMSNVDRAVFANESGAEIMVRIHANSVDNTDVKGALCFAPGSDNPYLSAELISESQRLSQVITDQFCLATGAQNRGVDESNTLTGLNWTTIPCTYVEMGFMSNTEEDLLMATDDYQNKMAEGIANGIDAYFAG